MTIEQHNKNKLKPGEARMNATGNTLTIFNCASVRVQLANGLGFSLSMPFSSAHNSHMYSYILQLGILTHAVEFTEAVSREDL